MAIKAKEAARRKRQNEKLRRMLEEEKKSVAGYEELKKIQSAYVAILLKKLGATEDNPVMITSDEIKEALAQDNVRAIIEDVGVWKFYCKE